MICRGIFLGPRLFGVFQKFLNRPLFGQHSMLNHMDRSAEGIRKKTMSSNLPERAKISKEDMEYILPEVVQVVETMSL